VCLDLAGVVIDRMTRKEKSEDEDRPLTPKGRAPVKATATQPQEHRQKQLQRDSNGDPQLHRDSSCQAPPAVQADLACALTSTKVLVLGLKTR
jgi:hypothetical protein